MKHQRVSISISIYKGIVAVYTHMHTMSPANMMFDKTIKISKSMSFHNFDNFITEIS